MSIGSVGDWRAAVARESNLHLLDFNDKKYLGGILEHAYEGDGLVDAYARFDAFLRRSTPPHTCPQRALRAFYLEELDALDDGLISFEKMCSFLGRRTEGVEKFLALKPLKFLEDHMSSVGLEALSARDIAVEISSTVRAQPDIYTKRPAGNLKADAKRRIDKKLADLITEASTITVHSALATSRSGLPHGSTFDPDPPEFSNNPMWVTSRDAIVSGERGPIPDQTDDALIRSAYAAGLKECLGLHNPSENEADVDRLQPVPPRDPSDPYDFGMIEAEAFASFAISFLLEVDLAGMESPRQPCIFSDGYNHLFVSRSALAGPAVTPEEGMPGRTVRLRDQNCRGRRHGAHCLCGSVGLPEAVLPTAIAMKNGAKPEMYTVVFASDLRYEPPEPDMIRQKNV